MLHGLSMEPYPVMLDYEVELDQAAVPRPQPARQDGRIRPFKAGEGKPDG
jgi:hypothetical protein